MIWATEYQKSMWALFYGPCKEGTIGNTLPEKGTLTKQGTYIMAISVFILNSYHVQALLNYQAAR